MRISRGALLDPARNNVFAVPAVAITIFVYAYSTRFGPIAILAYYGLWLPLFALDPQRIVGRLRDLALPGAFVLLLVASTIWSDAPSVTLRGSIQFATHALCVLAMAKVTNLRSLTRGILAGTALVVLYSLAFGYSAYDVIDGSYTFVGAFGSKNQLGLYCSVGILFALFSLFTQRESLLVRTATILLVVLCVLVLDASRSATSTITLGTAIIAFFGLIAILRFRAMLRGFVLMLLLPAGVLLAVIVQQMGAIDAILRFFGKDPTLTGRTYLWGEAMRTFWEAPVAGVGYMGYWVQGLSEAERLWHEFYIASRSGFHFHNTFVETLVETGIVGTALMVLLFSMLVLSSIRRVVFQADTVAACQFSLLVMLLARAVSEVDVLYPYTLGSFLLFYLCAAAIRKSSRTGLPFGAAYAERHAQNPLAAHLQLR